MRTLLPFRAGGTKNVSGAQGGFSLIEVAIGLVIIGLIVTPMVMLYNIEAKKSYQNSTIRKMAQIGTNDGSAALNQFFASNGRYPCPASLIVGEGNADHGVENADCVAADYDSIPLCTSATWRVNDGVCRTSAIPADMVIIGAVPFNALNINANDTVDAWGNKILYAVTALQTNSATFFASTGAIRVGSYDDPDNNAATPPVINLDVTGRLPNPPDYILVSFGENGRGAYTADGVLVAACPDPMDGIESRNCDFDNSFFLDNHPVDTAKDLGSRSYAVGTRYYDDITRFQVDIPQAIWFEHPNHAGRLMTMSTRVGVGTNGTAIRETLDVRGNIRADNNAKSNSLCTIDGTACFDPRFITLGTQCASNQTGGVSRVQFNSFTCASTATGGGIPLVLPAPSGVTPGYQRVQCSTGYLQRGFLSTGAPDCFIP